MPEHCRCGIEQEQIFFYREPEAGNRICRCGRNDRKQVTAFADAGETEEAQDAGGGGIFASVSQVWNAVLLQFLIQRMVFASGKVVSCPERYIPIYNKVSGMGKTRKRVSPVPLFCFVDECLLKRRFSQIYF